MRPLNIGHRVIDLDEVNEVVIGLEDSAGPEIPVRVTYANGEIWRFTGEDAEMIRPRFDVPSIDPLATTCWHHPVSYLVDDLS